MLGFRTQPTFLEILISKSVFGPVKLPGLSRNGPLDSLSARPSSAPLGGGKKGEFRDWTRRALVERKTWGICAPRCLGQFPCSLAAHVPSPNTRDCSQVGTASNFPSDSSPFRGSSVSFLGKTRYTDVTSLHLGV